VSGLLSLAEHRADRSEAPVKAAALRTSELRRPQSSALDSNIVKDCQSIFRVPSSWGQQAVDIYLVLCAYINMPVHDRRDVKP
jgi:hypothetical protein